KPTWKEGASFSAHEGGEPIVHWLAFVPDGGTLVSASYDGTVKFWDVLRKKQLSALPPLAFGRPYYALDLAANGKVLAAVGVEDGNSIETIKLWNVAAGRELYTFRTEDRHTRCVALSPDGSTLATGGTGEVNNQADKLKLWDVATGK